MKRKTKCWYAETDDYYQEANPSQEENGDDGEVEGYEGDYFAMTPTDIEGTD